MSIKEQIYPNPRGESPARGADKTLRVVDTWTTEVPCITLEGGGQTDVGLGFGMST
jgi:hypothetical protein